MTRARIRKSIRKIKPYVPGTSSYDLGRPIIKLSSNENPYGPSPRAVEAIRGGAERVNLYPDKEARALRSRLASELGVGEGCICIGNGSDDLLENLAKLYLSEGDNLVTNSAFSTYETIALSCGSERRLAPDPPGGGMDVEGLKAASDGRTKILLVCTPSNPTGSVLTEEQIDDLLDHCTRAGIFLVLDEAYADFSEAYRSPAASFARGEAEGAVTRTFSKAHGLAGLRIGYCIAPEEVVTYINLVRMPFNASTIAQEAALAALEDREHYNRCVELIRGGRRYLSEELSGLGLGVNPSQANFVLVSVAEVGHDARSFAEAARERGFAVRDCTSFGLPEHVRVSVGTEEQNRAFVSAIKTLLRN